MLGVRNLGSIEPKRQRFYAARLGVDDAVLSDVSTFAGAVVPEGHLQGASGEEVGVQQHHLASVVSPGHDSINDDGPSTATSCSDQSGMSAQAQSSGSFVQRQKVGERGVKDENQSYLGSEPSWSGSTTLDVETSASRSLRDGSPLVGGAEVVFPETITVLLPSATAFSERIDEQDLHNFSRRRRDFTVDGYVGLKLNPWVTLGDDLRGRGFTLGLDKFLLQESVDSWHRQEPVERSDSGGPSAHSNQNADLTSHSVEEECVSLPSTEGPVTGQLSAATSSRGQLTTTHSIEPSSSIMPSSGLTVRISLSTGSDLTTRLASAIRAIQCSTPRSSKPSGQEDSCCHLQLAEPTRLRLRELSSEKGQLLQAFEDPQVCVSPGQVSQQGLKRKFLEAGRGVLQWPVGGDMKFQVREVLRIAAKALADGDTALFKRLRFTLQPYVKHRGKGWERASYCLLHSLTLREQGEGPAVLRRRLRLTIKEMTRCLIWMFLGMPLCPFAVISTIGALLPRLIGKTHVHILNFGEVMVPQLSTFLRLLCSSTRKPRLKSFRLTHVRAFPLCRPGRPEFETAQPPEVLASMVHRTAEELGVDFSFQGIILKEDNLSLLDRVERSQDETVGVCSLLELKFISEELGDLSGSALHKLQACITRLQPDVLCWVEEDVDASCRDFTSRFASWQEFLWAVYEGGDGCIGAKDVGLLHDIEDTVWRQVSRSVVGCEGRERRWRPRSGEQQEQILLSCGMQQLPVPSNVMERVQAMSARYPEGWAVVEERCGLSLMFRGTKILRSSSWTWPAKQSDAVTSTYSLEEIVDILEN